MSNDCSIKLPDVAGIPCCNYVRPTVKNIVVRKKKNGQIQIKINGKGKWINAEMNGNTISYQG